MLPYQRKHAYQTQGHEPELAAQTRTLGEALGRLFVSYYPVLADITGSPKAALMLGHAIQCTKISMTTRKGTNGSFWKTAGEWYLETGLSVREVETSRKTLKELGLLTEVRQGMPAKLWYTLNVNKLSAMICEHNNIPYRDWIWDQQKMKALLGKAIITYASFSWIADSAVAGLYLSRLYNDTRNACSNGSLTARRDKETWIKAPLRHSLHDLRIGRKSLINARAKLVEAGLIAELRDARMQSILITRILFDETTDKLNAVTTQYRNPKYENTASNGAAVHLSPKRVTRDAENAKQEIPKTQNNIYPLCRTSYAVSAHPIYKEDLYITKQLQHKAEQAQHPEPASPLNPVKFVEPVQKSLLLDFNDLIFPPKITLLQEKQSILSLFELKQVTDNTQAQLLLHELTGCMQHRAIHNPIGYLRTMIDNHQKGLLIFNYAHKIKHNRDQCQHVAAQRRMAQKQASLLPSTPEDVIAREKGRAMMDKIREQRNWTRA